MIDTKMTTLRRRLVAATVVFVTTFLVGVMGYRTFGGEDHTWLDAVYMTANVLTTVGFREAVTVEGNPPAMVFTVILLFFGAGAVVFATSVMTAFIVEGDLTQGFRSRRMQRTIEEMAGHYIVCGTGATGYAVLRELVATQRQVVVIELNDERLRRVQDEFPAVPVIKGDFTDDEVLARAGIGRAGGGGHLHHRRQGLPRHDHHRPPAESACPDHRPRDQRALDLAPAARGRGRGRVARHDRRHAHGE